MDSTSEPLDVERSTTAHARRTDVLALVAGESVTGPGRQLAGLASALRSAGIGIHVLILWRRGNPRPPYADYLSERDVSCELIEDRGPLDRSILEGVDGAIRRLQPRILQTHGYKATATAWGLRLRGQSIPWVGFFHGHTRESLRARFYHFLDRRMLRAADRVIVMSARQQSEFGRYAHHVQVIHNAIVPLARSSAEAAGVVERKLRGLPAPRIGVVGRLSPEKGVDLFIAACERLARDGLVFSGVIAGDGPERDALALGVENAGLANRIVLLGHVSAADALYEALDLLVIPSRSEGLPNVLLEALAADLPVVATSVGAIPEVLDQPGAGRLVEPGSAEELARAIRAAMDEGDGARGRSARARIMERFSMERRLDRHLRLYRDLVPDLDLTPRGSEARPA